MCQKDIEKMNEETAIAIEKALGLKIKDEETSVVINNIDAWFQYIGRQIMKQCWRTYSETGKGELP